MGTITITKDEYAELLRKAQAYDRMVAGASKGAKEYQAKMTPEQRSERAKKAVAARIAKYGQKSRTQN